MRRRRLVKAKAAAESTEMILLTRLAKKQPAELFASCPLVLAMSVYVQDTSDLLSTDILF